MSSRQEAEYFAQIIQALKEQNFKCEETPLGLFFSGSRKHLGMLFLNHAMDDFLSEQDADSESDRVDRF